MSKYNLKKVVGFTSAIALAATLNIGLPALAQAEEVESTVLTHTEGSKDFNYSEVFDTEEEAEKAKDDKEKELTDSEYEDIESTITEIPGEAEKGNFSETYDTEKEAEEAYGELNKELEGSGYENISGEIKEVPGEAEKGSFSGTYDTKEEAENAKTEKENEFTEAGYENIESTITEIPGEAEKGNFSGTYDTKEEAENAKTEKENEFTEAGYENIESTITEIPGEAEKGSYSETFDTMGEAESARFNKENELLEAGATNIKSGVTEVPGAGEEFGYNGTFASKAEAENALEDFANGVGGEVTSSTITENNNLFESVSESGSQTFENQSDAEDYVDELKKKETDGYRLEITEEDTTVEKKYLVVSSTSSGILPFDTKEAAEEYIASLGTSTEYRIVETTLTSKSVLDESVETEISQTFDSELEAEQYIQSLKDAGYDVSELETILSSFEETTWKNEDGVIVDPGQSDNKTFNYGHFDVTLITSFTKIDADGNSSTVNGTITVDNVTINKQKITMTGPSIDPNDGKTEYTSVERNKLSVTNKSLVTITGTVKFNGKTLPYEVSGYLSEEQNKCHGLGNAKGFDLEFKSITIVNNKVYVDSNIVNQYKVSGTAKKDTYKTIYEVGYTITEKEDAVEYVPAKKVSYTLYKQRNVKTYTLAAKVLVPTKAYQTTLEYEMPTKDYQLDVNYDIPTKDYQLNTTYDIPTKDYQLDVNYDIPTSDFLLEVTANEKAKEIVPSEDPVTPVVYSDVKANKLAQTGDNTSMVIPAGAAIVALGGMATAGYARRKKRENI